MGKLQHGVPRVEPWREGYRPVRAPDRHPDVEVPWAKADRSAREEVMPYAATAGLCLLIATIIAALNESQIGLLLAGVGWIVLLCVTLFAYLKIRRNYWFEYAERFENTLYEHEEKRWEGYKGKQDTRYIVVNGGKGKLAVDDPSTEVDETLEDFVRQCWQARKSGMDCSRTASNYYTIILG